MNSIWITNMCAYRHTPMRIASAQNLINKKIERRGALLKKYGKATYHVNSIKQTSIQSIMLFEARAAKQFWKQYRLLLPDWCSFEYRWPRHGDTVNFLLDVGYHHVTQKVIQLISKHNIVAALGIMHEARNADSKPLAYDLVELFRADIVDAEVLRFLRMKKRPLKTVTPRIIAHLLSEINERMNKKHYLRSFHQCHKYFYYMELQLLKFMQAVNKRKVFHPIHLPTRHDSRCS